jgi:hypothetical protein
MINIAFKHYYIVSPKRTPLPLEKVLSYQAFHVKEILGFLHDFANCETFSRLTYTECLSLWVK